MKRAMSLAVQTVISFAVARVRHAPHLAVPLRPGACENVGEAAPCPARAGVRESGCQDGVIWSVG